ncbi:MAG: InlB B-repeat-containing protein, partial [Planctomycetota bacterium]
MIATRVKSPFVKAFFGCVMFFASEALGLEVSVSVSPTTLNLGSSGTPITCTVSLPAPYVPADVVSVTLEGVSPYSTSGGGTLTCKFHRASFVTMLAPYAPGEVVLTLSGTLADGTDIEGTDTITVKFADIVITSSAGPNGSIAPAGTTTVTYGSDLAFTATPDTGYHVDAWSVDGGVVQTGGTSYTLADIHTTHTVSVTFDINTYTLTYNAGAHGSISGASPQTVNHGADGNAVTAVPDTGYHFVNWSDGSTDNPRTDTNVTADIAVTANFEINTYTLTYSAGAHGSISGASPQT